VYHQYVSVIRHPVDNFTGVEYSTGHSRHEEVGSSVTVLQWVDDGKIISRGTSTHASGMNPLFRSSTIMA
jgi:hypothetical protein